VTAAPLRPTATATSQRRGGIGVIATKFKRAGKGAAPDALCALRVVSAGDQLLLSTAHGTIVRQPAGRVSGQSRAATGVRVQKLDDGDEIASVAVVPEDFLDDDEEEAEGGGAASGGDAGGGARELAAA
jgi:DNA gyrase subunit A